MSVLPGFAAPETTGWPLRLGQHPVAVDPFTAVTPYGPLRYRIYKPTDIPNPGGLVLLHGMHVLGIEEPRLTSLGRAVAGAGLEIMTPELADLADYRVTPQAVDFIGISAVILSNQLKTKNVGVTGLSFAGGLALVAATRPEYASHMRFVVAIGSHDDLTRVSRFFATDTIERIDGTSAPFAAHEYGTLVLAFAHLDYFFSEEDTPIAREALRLWLHEKNQPSLEAAQRLTPQGREILDLILHHRDQFRPPLLEEIVKYGPEMAPVSPHGLIGKLTVPVYLLHGAGDNVIAPNQCIWLAHDLPAAYLSRTLTTPVACAGNIDVTGRFWRQWG